MQDTAAAVREIATYIANIIPEAFSQPQNAPDPYGAYDLDVDFSDYERRRYRELAEQVVTIVRRRPEAGL